MVSGTLGTLFSRPKPEEIQLISVEQRLEAYWDIRVHLRTVYERNRTYSIPLSGPEIDHVSLLGQDVPVTKNKKDEVSLSLDGVEHCVEESQHKFTCDGEGTQADMSQYQDFPKTEIVDLESFAPEGVLVVPPKALASTVVRSVLSEVIKPVDGQIIHEERVDIEGLDINFRPVYAMEYHWVPKDKHEVLEFDALTGEIIGRGEKMADQIKGVLTPELLFDVTAVAAGALVPGGSAAVKLVKVAYDHTKK
ncbi:MAG: hypothetical protein ACK2TV_14805 [Anaerolineales bacterium]